MRPRFLLGWFVDSTLVALAIDNCIVRDATIPVVPAIVCVWLVALLHAGVIALGVEWGHRLDQRCG